MKPNTKGVFGCVGLRVRVNPNPGVTLTLTLTLPNSSEKRTHVLGSGRWLHGSGTCGLGVGVKLHPAVERLVVRVRRTEKRTTRQQERGCVGVVGAEGSSLNPGQRVLTLGLKERAGVHGAEVLECGS